MRAKSSPDAAYHASGMAHEVFRWLQAGLKSSAYRLAHLYLPKAVIMPGLVTLFFLA